jgi:hypothetical protein
MSMNDPSLPVAPESRRRVALQHNPLSPLRPVDIDISQQAFTSGLVLTTCPQCGVNPAAGKTRTFSWVNPWLYVTIAAGIVVFLIIVAVARVRATGWLPLCEDCARADNRARNLSGLALASVLLAPILFGILGSTFGAGLLMAAFGLVAGLVGAVTASWKLAPQIVSCRKIDKGVIRFRASPTWRETIARERPEALVTGG